MNYPVDLKYSKSHEWVKYEDGIAVIGDASKFIGAKAVTASAPGSVTLYEGGVLKIWSETPITSADDENGALTVQKAGDLYTVRTEKGGVITYC